MGIAVRRVRVSDTALLRSVRLAALHESPSAFGSSFELERDLDEAAWSERAARGSSGPASATFFACNDDRVVGLVGGYRQREDATEVELVSMWTAPEARHQGVGRQLVDAILEWAAANGASTVSLWVTRGNEPAQRLYEHCGFNPTGDYQPLPSDPCKDELRMTRHLAAVAE